jgi:pimeloyl-ACP methyl ester carboxylesterase
MMKLVLLPGLDGTGLLFQPLVEVLSGEFDIQIISYPTDRVLGYSELTEYVATSLPADKFVLLAESFSGPVAYRIAKRKPKNLQSVIFVASFLSSPGKGMLKLANHLPMGRLARLPVPGWFARKYLFGAPVSGEMLLLLRKALCRVATGVVSNRLGEISRLVAPEAPCEAKSIYIQGTTDWLVPASSVEDFRSTCRDLTVFPVQGGHFLLQSNPLACAEIIGNEAGHAARGAG